MNTAVSLLAIAILVCAATAFAPMGITTKRSELYMRRGRGSGLKRELDDSSSSSSFTGGMGGGAAAGGTNWLNTNKSIKELPEEEGKVCVPALCIVPLQNNSLIDNCLRDDLQHIARLWIDNSLVDGFSRETAHLYFRFILIVVVVL